MILDVELKGLEKKFYELSQEVVSEAGYYLYDMEYIKGSKTLRVYIMNKETKTAVIEDCVAVDRAFSEPMEAGDWIPDDIVLEVSSPGMFRKIKTKEHFELSKGERILVLLNKKFGELFEGESFDKKTANAKKILCVLNDVGDDFIEVNLDSEFDLKLNLNDINKVALEPEV